MSDEVKKAFPDVDPFLLTKWEKLFKTFFDHHRQEENLDQHDFYIVTKKVKDIYGADSEQMGYARESLKSLWEGLLAAGDTNKDKIISLNEWVTLLKNHDPTKGEVKWFQDYLSFMFKLFDVSADKLLDIAEYTDGMEAYGFDQAYSHNAWKQFALDKSGKEILTIDFPTFKCLWHEYFYAKDPAAKGNHLFGLM